MANTEKALRHFRAPQSGQAGFLSDFERTSTSKRFPQAPQSYSKIGTLVSRRSTTHASSKGPSFLSFA